LPSLEQVLTSLRQVSRGLRRSPASAIAAIVTLALTLAAATAIFAVVDATLLTPPPFADPSALVEIGEIPVNDPATALRAVSAQTLDAWRAQSLGAIRLEAYDGTNVTLTGGRYPERLNGILVSPGYLPMLGVTPRIGRTFSERDAAEGSAIIVSDAGWRSLLLGDPNPLGRTLMIDGRARSVIGVLPPTSGAGLGAAVWMPMAIAPGDPDGARVRVVGRLTPGVTIATASALLGATPGQSRDLQPAVLSLPRLLQGRAADVMPFILLAAGLGVALAAVNLAGLMVLRAMDRSRELAVRAALGATRTDLLKPLVLEAHVLVTAGALCGVLLALWLTPAAAQLASMQLGMTAAGAAIGWRAGAVLIVVALACAWISALAPALAAAKRFDLSRTGRDQISQAPTTVALRRVFVAAEIAVAFVLLAAVVLVGRSLQAVIAIEPGFVPDQVLAAPISIPAARYPDARSIAQFYRQLEEALASRFARNQVAIIDELPLSDSSSGRIHVALSRDGMMHQAVARVAGPGYFELLAIPIFEGRTFNNDDRGDATPIAVVSRSLAERLYQDTRVLGRTLWIPSLNTDVQIVGVVGDVKHRSLEEETMPTLYFSAAQQPSRSSNIVLRTGRPDADTLDIVRAEVARLDPEVPVYGRATLDEVIQRSAGVPIRRVVSAMFAAFALLALVIAAVGVFGVVAHDVSARRLEMALRLALGAHPTRLLHAVLRQAAAILVAGLAAGMALSLFFSRLLNALLYGVTATDAVTIVLVTALLSCTMLLAASVPARRAARTNPVALLRGE
jgi:predicted permease